MLLNLSVDLSRKNVSAPEHPIDFLNIIDPVKFKIRKKSEKSQIIIDSKYIFWPLIINNIKTILPDYETIISRLYPYFDSIIVITDSKQSKNLPDVQYLPVLSNSEKGIHLTIIEAGKLSDCIEHSYFTDEIYCAVKIEEEDYIFVKFQNNTVLADLSAQIEKKLDISISSLTPFSPFTGIKISPDTIIDNRINCICFNKKKVKFNLPFHYQHLRKSASVKEVDTTDFSDSETPCCNCLNCSSVCPSGISPNVLYHLILNNDVEDIENYNINDCIRCSRCTAVCPSNIPLYSGINKYFLEKKNEENEDS